MNKPVCMLINGQLMDMPIDDHMRVAVPVLKEIIYMDDHCIAFDVDDTNCYREGMSPHSVFAVAKRCFKNEDGRFVGKRTTIKLAEAWYEYEHDYRWPLVNPAPNTNLETE